MVKAKNFITTDGRREFTIDNITNGMVTIRFIDDNSTYTIPEDSFKYGIDNPAINQPLIFNKNNDYVLGRYFKTNNNGTIKILNADRFNDVQYQFQDDDGYIGITTMQNIRNGQIKNPYDRNEWGGYIGEGPYNKEGNIYEKKYNLYNKWHMMGNRASGCRKKYSYYEKSQLYDNSAICNEWLCFNIFADWYVKNIEKLNPKYNYEMDKDLLYPMYKNQTNSIKLYCPTTISLITHELNLALHSYHNICNYEYSKEKTRLYILNMAEIYHSEGAMTDKTYRAIRALYANDKDSMTYIDFRHNNYNISPFVYNESFRK